MIMEIYLNENKAKDNNIDIESCYKKIDNYFLIILLKLTNHSDYADQLFRYP